MCQCLYKIPCVSILILFFTGNLPAQTIFFPQEPMSSRMEKIVEAGKGNGQFVTYETRFLEGITARSITTGSNDMEDWLRLSLKDTPLTYKIVSPSRFVIVLRANEKPAVGYLAGKITDSFGLPLFGATVQVQALPKGTIAGMNGDYSLALPVGPHAVQVSFIGYETAQTEHIEIKESGTTRLDIALKETDIHLDEVIVTYAQPENTIEGAIRAQQNTPYVSSVLARQQINRSASTTVQEALRLLPGISVGENEELITRGTGGRWNEILLDGISLPNYDPSYKIFSFDLIPVTLVDNVRLLKSSTPDIPVGFAGGITEIITKDIPERNYIEFKASYPFNELSTFKTLRGRRKGKFDFIGFDDGTRGIPASLLSVTPGNPERMTGNNTLLPPEHFTIYDRVAPPSQDYNLTIGRTHTLRKRGDRFGFVLSLSYQNRSQQSDINHTQRGRWDYTGSYTGNLNSERNRGHIYYYNTVTGGILNAGWQFGKNRISIRNVFTRSFDNDLTEITARLKDTPGSESNLSYQFFNYPTFSDLYRNKLEGQHAIGGVLLRWNTSHTFVQRERKDAAFSEMYKPLKDDSLLYFLNQYPELRTINPASSGWYTNRERDFHLGLSASVPFLPNDPHHKAVIGYNGNYKRIRFTSNEALYSYDNNNEITDPSLRIYQILERNYFSGSMTHHFPFVMFEHRWKDRIRLVWGIRGDYESYETISTHEQIVPAHNRKWYIAPSANIVFTPLKDLNLRLSFQRSVIRPQLADYIPYPVYDTSLLGTAVNRTVSPSTVQAVDFLIEKYINPQDLVSAGFFYRHIDRPIERTTYLYRYDEPMYVLQNSDKAYCYGFETEIRKHLDFAGDSGFLRKVQLFTGFILTRSSVKGKRVIVIPQENGEDEFITTESTQERPLSGQMPYNLNAGISYDDKKINVNILLNRSGRQLFLLGENAYQHEYRAPLNSLETSISYRFPKSDIMLKLSGRNLLNSDLIFYTNTPDDYVDEHGLPTERLLPDKTENYDKGVDPIIHQVKNGRSWMISLSRTF
jgi:Outer membrane receptor proteins, mostly Fe transport